MKLKDTVEINDNEVKPKIRFDQREWNYIAEYICDTYEKRKDKRKDLEKIWNDLDRQIAMIPETSHKSDANGNPDPQMAWMAEVELPLQAQTLEVLTADARRMLSPDSGSWYTPHAITTDEYLARVDFQSFVAGDQNEVPSLITQDNADKLVQGVMNHWHRQYDFWGNIDKINAEAFKYGMGIGRGRLANKRLFMNTAKGVVVVNKEIPILVPRSIKNIYLDDSEAALANEGHIVGGSTVAYKCQKFEDVMMAAKGSSDPDKMDGGWMAKQLVGVKPDKNGNVEILEMEGDFIIPRKTTGSIFIPNCIITVVAGDKKDTKKVIRFRWNKFTTSSYVEFPYHYESLDTPYPTSPLIKGWPIAKAAANALCRLQDSASLKLGSPVSYDKDDGEFAQSGGPRIHPYASWPSMGDIKVHDEVGGDPNAMFAIYAGHLQHYADVTGVSAPRLGAETKSHTTAYAKESEINRGTIRTVDYVRASLKNPFAKWLSMEYEIGRPTVKDDTIYIDAYGSYVTISAEHLPDMVTFEAHGAGGAAEEQAKQQAKLQSLQFAMQLDTTGVQLGKKPRLNLDGAIEQVLREGGWKDIDILLLADELPQDSQDIPGLVGANFQAPEVLG